MAAVQARAPRRAIRGSLVLGVALAHIGVFLLLSLSQPREPADASSPPHEILAVVSSAPPQHTPPPRGKSARKRQAQAPAPPRAATPQGAPAWTLPGSPSKPASSRELADPFAVREALRASVGCDQEGLKLRPDEEQRCADRTAKWARRGRVIGPAADDPKRAAELAAEEDYQRRRHDWKYNDCGVGVGGDAKATLGQMPPRRGQSKAGEDAERANAC